jgi:hypothetical protein
VGIRWVVWGRGNLLIPSSICQLLPSSLSLSDRLDTRGDNIPL